MFDFQPQLSLTTFEFTADMSPLPPIHVEVGENLLSSVLQEDAAELAVDFDKPGAFFKSFALNLDKENRLRQLAFDRGLLDLLFLDSSAECYGDDYILFVDSGAGHLGVDDARSCWRASEPVAFSAIAKGLPKVMFTILGGMG